MELLEATFKFTAISTIAIAIVACAGGGGASLATSPISTAGLSVSAPANFNNATAKGTLGTPSIDPTFTLSTTGSLSAGTVTALTINTVNATTTGNSFTIAQDATHSVTSTPGSAEASLTTPTANSTQDIVVGQPAGFSYTQIGSWGQCSANCIAGTTTEVVGIFVRGEATAPANIPTTGSFTYNGTAFGVGTDSAGNVASGLSNMAANANFASRSIAFSTSGTVITPSATGVGVSDPTFDMVGTLTYAAGQNLFTGTVTAGSGVTAQTGTATGRFNGPAAQEIGGVFSLSGSGRSLIGGFTGK